MTETFSPGTPTPLLAYALTVDPDPLCADTAAALSLMGSNAGDPVTCQSIQLTLPIGTNATDLISGIEGIATEQPDGWTAQVGMNGLVMLGWEALNADHCLLGDGTKLAASGQLYFLVTADRTFTVTAVAADGRRRQVQATVTMDSSIQPTEAGHVVTGAAGEPGAPGQVRLFGLSGTPGGPAGTAGTASATIDGQILALPRSARREGQ